LSRNTDFLAKFSSSFTFFEFSVCFWHNIVVSLTRFLELRDAIKAISRFDLMNCFSCKFSLTKGSDLKLSYVQCKQT